MHVTISDQLRRAIDDSGMSLYALSQQCGVSRSALGRFMAGGSAHLTTVDAIAGVLGLRIVADGLPPRGNHNDK